MPITRLATLISRDVRAALQLFKREYIPRILVNDGLHEFVREAREMHSLNYISGLSQRTAAQKARFEFRPKIQAIFTLASFLTAQLFIILFSYLNLLCYFNFIQETFCVIFSSF